MPWRQAEPLGRNRRAVPRRRRDRWFVLAKGSTGRYCPTHRRAREFWCSARRAIDRSLARRFFSGAGAVLMGTHDSGVEHHVLVVVVTRQQLENALENSALGPSAEALVEDLPIPETLRQIAPGDTRPISVHHRIDEQSIVCLGAAISTLATRQK